MDSFLCCLCRASIASGSAVCLFSQTAVRQNLPGRITDLLDVPKRQKMASLSTFVINVRESWSDWREQQRSWRIFELKQAANHTILVHHHELPTTPYLPYCQTETLWQLWLICASNSGPAWSTIREMRGDTMINRLSRLPSLSSNTKGSTS